MHAGKNFGRLSIVLPEQTLTFEVCATTDGAKAVSEEHLELQRGRMRLAQLYIDYRLKKDCDRRMGESVRGAPGSYDGNGTGV